MKTDRMKIDRPAPDLAQVAKGFGWHSEGAIEDSDRVENAPGRTANVVASTGQPALVDVVCQYR